ncbi:DUF1995 family protein [Cyanobium sp. FGCU-52]|nr:DUF1995 family protein [Cyanobium sp. FGCU52]
MLPADLLAAEQQLLQALRSALAADPNGRWTAELRFEGLRLLPVALRLAEELRVDHPALRLLFPDAGAAALARRDAPQLAEALGSYGDERRRQAQGEEAAAADLLILVAPAQTEYEEVEALCEQHRGPVVLLNPSLEDAAVGIGSVARQRRRGFLSLWQSAYALVPQAGSALRRAHPGEWELYRLDPDGFRPVATFERKPDAEEQERALAGGAEPGLGANLRALGDLIEGLQK